MWLKLDLSGKRFGRLVAVEEYGRDNRGRVVWLCRCDCGVSGKAVVSSLLIRGNVKSCGCLQKSNRISSIAHARKFRTPKMPGLDYLVKRSFGGYRSGAKRRGLGFSITIEQFFALSQMDCVYCGIEPQEREWKGQNSKGKMNGLDRVDSNDGYIISNVVPCCFHCNRAKQDMGVVAFCDWVKRVYLHSVENDVRHGVEDFPEILPCQLPFNPKAVLDFRRILEQGGIH